MTRKKSRDESDDTAALAAEAARLEAKKALDDSGAVESAALSEVALTDADVVAETPTSPVTDADVIAEIPAFEPQPEWVAKAKPLSGKTGEPNGAWHDYFKGPLPVTPPVATWTGKDATFNQYEGGRILAKYHQGGFYAVLTTPPPPVVRRPAARR